MPEPVVLFNELPTSGDYFIGTACLNAERSLNALSLPMCQLLLEQLGRWQNDNRCIAVLLRGAGDKAFCAGGDIMELYHSIITWQNEGRQSNNEYAEGFFTTEYRLDYLIHTYPKPIICWGNGYVMGGGIGLLAGASHRVATESSRIAMPEINIGLFPDVGGTFFLRQTPGNLGLFLGLTAYQMNAADAVFTGLADRIIANAELPKVIEVLRNIEWQNCDDHHGMISKVLRQFENKQSSQSSQSPLREHFDLLNDLLDGDSLQDIYQQLTAYQTEIPWLEKGIQALKNGCPMTAHLVYEQLRRGRHLSLKEVFQMELVIATQCSRHENFAEGVRALLVDKDNSPKWTHASVADITPGEVAAHFASPWAGSETAAHPLADLGQAEIQGFLS